MHICDNLHVNNVTAIFLQEVAIPTHFYSCFYQRNTISSDFLTTPLSNLVKVEHLVLHWDSVQQVALVERSGVVFVDQEVAV